MIEIAQRWLNDQQSQQRELLLIVDRLAEPDPIVELFGAGLMQDYVNLYQGTEFADMEDAGPWLVRLHNPDAEFIQTLLNTPERDWGWLASAEAIDLSALASHWRDRLAIEDDAQPALYRFQDNRVITRHLLALPLDQRPLLLGPLAHVLSWDGQHWQSIDNPAPGFYPAPPRGPWLELPEPDAVSAAIQRHNLEQWLWQQHTPALCQLLETQPFDAWLEQCLAQAKTWGWRSTESLHFLLEHQLDSARRDHPAWPPQAGETAEVHLARCQQALSAPATRNLA